MTEIIREIGPEDLAARPYRLRCLTPGCWLDRDPSTAEVAESLNSVGELHVATTKHRVVIERISLNGKTERVAVHFRSAGLRDLCNKEQP